MKIHLLGLAHLPIRKEFISFPYVQASLRLAEMLKMLGHSVIFYGVEGSEVRCDTFIPVSNRKVIEDLYGKIDWTKGMFKYDAADKAHILFNTYAIIEIEKRKSDDDVLVMVSPYQEPIASALNLRVARVF